MAERQQNFTDFRDPFDLLTSLHNTRLRMIYQNEFARGNRTDMEMGSSKWPNSSIGPSKMAKVDLPVNAPTTQFDRSLPGPSYRPSAPAINYDRSYSQPTDSPQYANRELARFGSLTKKLTGIAGEANQSIQAIRQKARETAASKAEQDQIDAEQARIESATAPSISRYNELQEEMGDIQSQIDNRKLVMQTGEGLSELRRQNRQTQAQGVQAQNMAGFRNVAQNLPVQARTVLPRERSLSPYGLLQTPETPSVASGLRSIYESALPAPPQTPTTKVPPKAGYPIGSPNAIPSMKIDWSTSSIRPGATEKVKPYGTVEKSAPVATPTTKGKTTKSPAAKSPAKEKATKPTKPTKAAKPTKKP